MVPMPRKGLYVGTKDFIISNPNEKTILPSKISTNQGSRAQHSKLMEQNLGDKEYLRHRAVSKDS